MIAFGNVITESYGPLNADSPDTLSFWTLDELVEFAADAARDLAQSGMFVDRQVLTVQANSAGVLLPMLTLSIVHVSLNDGSLRPITFEELEALDSGWRATAGTVSRWALSISGEGILTLYKIPQSGSTGSVIRHTYPLPDSLSYTFRGSQVFGDHVLYRVLQKARSVDGDGLMPDAAAQCSAVADLYKAVFAQYWPQAE
jgi:hypothetical protein